MGRTSLCVLVLFLLSTLLYHGHAQGRTDAVLTLEPNRSHVFTGESVTFICDMREGQDTDWWYKINRNGQQFVRYSTSKRNTLQSLATGYSGEYQCIGDLKRDTYHKKESNKVTLIVSDGDVILESPAFALFVGESVTLRCRHRIQGNENRASFYRDGSLVEMDTNHPSIKISETTEEMTINPVSKTDKGSYKCKFGEQDGAESKERELKVEARRPKAKLSADTTAIPVGGSVTLTCSVQEYSGWKYYWYRKEKDSEPLTTEDDDPNSNKISVSQEGLYWCRGVRGDSVYYTQYSDSIRIDKNVANRAVVTLQPNWPQIYSGETITLRCEIQGGGDTDWEYEWRTTSSYKPPKQNEYRISSAYTTHSGDYSCKGRQRSGQQSSTEWSSAFKLTVSYKPTPVLTVSPVWLSPGASVTLSCEVEGSSAGWRFYWYKAVPKLSDNSYTYELLPGSNDGTAEGSYILHGPTHTGGYMCRAGRGDPVFYSRDSEPKFIWSGDRRSSASVTVSPNRTQHFSSESVSLSCEGNSTEWTVKRFTEEGYLEHCTSYWGSMTGSKCNIIDIRSSAVYWCESGSGEFSNAVNITGQYGRLILLSPVHPVTEGDSVTLGCKSRTEPLLSNVDFYRNDKLIQNETTGEMTIHAVSKSDEGFYKCKYSEYPGTESPQSWMAVKFAVSRPASSSFPVWLIIGLVTVILLIILLLLLCLCRKSKDPCCGRPIQSQSTNQGSTTDQREDQGNRRTPLHGDAYVYESIKGSEDTENGGPADESNDITYSSIELKNVHKKVKHVDPAESSVYSDVKIGSTTESNVTYAQVYHQNKGKAKDNKELSTPAEIQDTVYSEVKAKTPLDP
uniref:Fc receptor-like protein 5 isoform X2 n=1 Tax=Centroberyx gerrardi TaxID=166262 RepID=UPI003AACC798